MNPEFPDPHIVVAEILHILSGRGGFDWWWEDLEEDIRDEIIDALVARVDELI